jgi:thiol:disulfide interchange protein DsbD
VWTVVEAPSAVVPGHPFSVTVRVDLPEGFYQDAASPFLALDPVGPFQTVEGRSSPPSVRSGKASFHGSFTLTRTLTLASGSPPGPTPLTLKTGWQICRENGACLLPAEGTLALKVTAAGPGPGNLFGDPAFWAALLGALAGGLLLNVMPCVFPVLALKAVGLASSSGLTLGLRRREALAFAAGGFGTVFLLGVATAILAALGQRLDWGFSFQQPAFVWALALGFWLFALPLWGVWPWVHSPFSLRLPPGPGRAWAGGAFLVLAAAPCTAPLLGPALGFALGQNPLVIPVFFAAAGLGLVAPFLALSFLPAWGRWLPAPGPWMVAFERTAGFFLAATVVYLVWVLTKQTEPDRVWAALGVLGLVAAGGALAGWAPAPRALRRVAAAAVLLVAAGSLVPLAQPVPERPAGTAASDGWIAYTPGALAQARATGRPVLVDATAAWCATCQVNEWAVLGRPDVTALLDRLGVVRIRADDTRPNPAVHDWLASVGRAGLPVYALYVPGKPVFLFPELLTDGNFTQVVGRLTGP